MRLSKDTNKRSRTAVEDFLHDMKCTVMRAQYWLNRLQQEKK
jgi:hypothetical protein